MKVCGTVHKYGDNVDTDVIIPARYLNTSDHKELASHCMEDIDPEFKNNVKDGDIIVGEANFGCGSSREHAPIAIKASGISCVIAKTFARIFYRNSINTALPILECPEASDKISNGDKVEVDFDTGIITNITKNEQYNSQPFPEFIKEIITAGGLLNSLNKKTVEIRKAEHCDIETIAHIVNETWKVTYKGIVPDSDIVHYTNKERRENMLAEAFDKGTTNYFIADLNGTDCGIISYSKYEENDFEDCAYIMQLYVLPEYQKNGVGKRLMEHLFPVLKEEGYKRVILNTLEDNSNARTFYEKLGFEYFGPEDSPLFSERVVRALYRKELI